MTSANIVKGFFFDMDGTLVNTYQADFLAYRDAIHEVSGLTLDRNQYEALHGIEIGARLARLFPELSNEQVASIRASKKRLYRRHIHLTQLNDDLVRFLAQFSRHTTCALVTTAKQDNLLAVLEQHNLAKYFDVIVSGDDVARHKPDPEAYHLALQKTGLEPTEVLAFEDSAAGISVIEVKKFALS